MRSSAAFLLGTSLLLRMLPSRHASEGGTMAADPRNIETGSVIPSEGYCDQPYVVVTDDGNWLCTLTTGPGAEGDSRQHVVSTISTDKGKTWSPLVDIEPHGPPEASWVMPLKVPGGRVYAFYTYNADNLREVLTSSGKPTGRVDTLGRYAVKWSDDGGRSWSRDRRYLPNRVTAFDRENPYEGRVQFFWGVGKPMVHGGAAWLGAAKVGAFGAGFLEKTEGIFFRSDNVLAEPDPAKVRWTMLPDGDVGLRAPAGPIAEEHNLVALADGTLYCVYRTTQGHPCAAYSADGGHTWTPPAYAAYRPGGRLIKHPRAACFVRKFSNGRFLLWFHNHGGRSYDGRNPAWLSGGVEHQGRIHWSEPEIALYHPDPKVRMSYPDFIEQDGRTWITETQKTVARVHEIDPSLLAGLWSQETNRTIAARGLVFAWDSQAKAADMPRLPDLSKGGGFSIGLWVAFRDLAVGQVLLDARDDAGRGIALTTGKGTVRLDLGDGTTRDGWECDPGLLRPGTLHHIVATADGGPKIITFVVDGMLCDGGAARQAGWHRFDGRLGDANGSPRLAIAPSLDGELRSLRIYGRALRTSEAVGNFQAGEQEHERGRQAK